GVERTWIRPSRNRPLEEKQNDQPRRHEGHKAMRTIEDVRELATLAGQEIGTGEWLEITQERINRFADATNDHQWIHVDVERCKRESPFETTIAHGFLTLSLIPGLTRLTSCLRKPPKHTLNYGLNKVRFVTPVPVGSRVRARVVILDVTEDKRGH